MEARNSDYYNEAKRVFHEAHFVRDVGYELLGCGPGWCESRLITQKRHQQHDGVLHAGVQATMADHTAGTAATTLIAADEFVLTAEFKINLLRASRASDLRCCSEVIKSGGRLIVAKSELRDHDDSSDDLISFAIVTLAVLKKL